MSGMTLIEIIIVLIILVILGGFLLPRFRTDKIELNNVTNQLQLDLKKSQFEAQQTSTNKLCWIPKKIGNINIKSDKPSSSVTFFANGKAENVLIRLEKEEYNSFIHVRSFGRITFGKAKKK